MYNTSYSWCTLPLFFSLFVFFSFIIFVVVSISAFFFFDSTGRLQFDFPCLLLFALLRIAGVCYFYAPLLHTHTHTHTHISIHSDRERGGGRGRKERRKKNKKSSSTIAFLYACWNWLTVVWTHTVASPLHCVLQFLLFCCCCCFFIYLVLI